ncbi:MAG: flagellar motor switch protein FliG, partial [Paeniclostridium sordellii]|nr:flagellar motor switch protein FliG [Paeniclostridium sordellii]
MQNEGVKGNAFDLGDIPKFRRVTGARKAAILLMTLGPEVAASVIKNLSDRKIQKIGVEIANINTVKPRERREVLQEFIELNKGKEFVIEGGIDCAKSLLNGALGSQRATKLLEGIKYDAYTKLFVSARKAEPEQILACIQGESPQAIAILLSHIQPDKAAVVLSELSDELKLEISLKIGTTSNIPPAVIKSIDKAI